MKIFAIVLLKIACISTLSSTSSCDAFSPSNSQSRTRSSATKAPSVLSNSSNPKNEKDQNEDNINPFAKASWYAVETFGKLFAQDESSKENKIPLPIIAIDVTKPPSSAKETLERIKIDNDRDYFLSGQVDGLIYDKDCVFADPFVSFSGRDRFVENLSNLGSFITKYNAKMLNYSVSDDGLVVDTRVMVKLELNLPWKPILAWPWGVKYDIDEVSFLVTNHKESWDIEAMEGVKQIFRKPTLKIR
eukprot:scaffold1674_cov284-Chaetoceros_neogracile.AAC.12